MRTSRAVTCVATETQKNVLKPFVYVAKSCYVNKVAMSHMCTDRIGIWPEIVSSAWIRASKSHYCNKDQNRA